MQEKDNSFQKPFRGLASPFLSNHPSDDNLMTIQFQDFSKISESVGARCQTRTGMTEADRF
jgi:hypothetical protein